jgi:FixJ family two-component response regulator
VLYTAHQGGAYLSPDSPFVFVVDDDRRVREALSRLITSAGLAVVTFGSAAEFLEYEKPDAPACLLLDLQIPGMDGLELQQQLAEGDAPPIIFITGHGNIPSTVRAMKAGAVEFLSKPFDDEELLRAIDVAVEQDRQTRRKRSELSELRQRYALLTSREREVLPFVVAGFANKEAAADLGIAENTIAVHRGQITRKMGSRSLAELVRMADKLGVSSSHLKG